MRLFQIAFRNDTIKIPEKLIEKRPITLMQHEAAIGCFQSAACQPTSVFSFHSVAFYDASSFKRSGARCFFRKNV